MLDLPWCCESDCEIALEPVRAKHEKGATESAAPFPRSRNEAYAWVRSTLGGRTCRPLYFPQTGQTRCGMYVVGQFSSVQREPAAWPGSGTERIHCARR